MYSESTFSDFEHCADDRIVIEKYKSRSINRESSLMMSYMYSL